jgi:hypothetical protein
VARTHRLRGVFWPLLHSLAEIHRRVGVTDLMLWCSKAITKPSALMRRSASSRPASATDGASAQGGQGHPSHLIHIQFPAHADDAPCSRLAACMEALTRDPDVVEENLVPTA